MSEHLNAKIVTDLKEQLAAAQDAAQMQRALAVAAIEEARNERTRVEAAEQEAREERMRADDLLLVVKHCHSSSTHAAVMRGLNPAIGAVLDNAGKLAAIRAHLKGVDIERIDNINALRLRSVGGAASARAHWAGLMAEECANQLIAAAREALEP